MNSRDLDKVKDDIEKYESRLVTAQTSSSDNAQYYWISVIEEILKDLKDLKNGPVD